MHFYTLFNQFILFFSVLKQELHDKYGVDRGLSSKTKNELNSLLHQYNNQHNETNNTDSNNSDSDLIILNEQQNQIIKQNKAKRKRCDAIMNLQSAKRQKNC